MRFFSPLWYRTFLLYGPKNIKINSNSEIKKYNLIKRCIQVILCMNWILKTNFHVTPKLSPPSIYLQNCWIIWIQVDERTCHLRSNTHLNYKVSKTEAINSLQTPNSTQVHSKFFIFQCFPSIFRSDQDNVSNLHNLLWSHTLQIPLANIPLLTIHWFYKTTLVASGLHHISVYAQPETCTSPLRSSVIHFPCLIHPLHKSALMPRNGTANPRLLFNSHP